MDGDPQVIDSVPVGYDKSNKAANHNVVYFSRDGWAFDSSTALAVTLTTYRTRGGGLVDADIIVNEAHYSWGVGEDVEHDLEMAERRIRNLDDHLGYCKEDLEYAWEQWAECWDEHDDDWHGDERHDDEWRDDEWYDAGRCGREG